MTHPQGFCLIEVEAVRSCSPALLLFGQGKALQLRRAASDRHVHHS
jgi:hypothetical protein